MIEPEKKTYCPCCQSSNIFTYRLLWSEDEHLTTYKEINECKNCKYEFGQRELTEENKIRYKRIERQKKQKSMKWYIEYQLKLI